MALLPPDQISIGFRRTSLEKVMSTFKILEQTFVIDQIQLDGTSSVS